MITHRFYLPPQNWTAPFSELSEADTHHCAKVLRMAIGDALVVFDGLGKEATATITEFRKQGKYHALLSLGEQIQTPPPRTRITLAQGVPKSKRMDFIIQKAVELGASRIVPLLSERTVLRCSDEADASHKQERWAAIAIEACKQCGQNWLPVIETPCSLHSFFEKSDPTHLLLIASLEKERRSLKEVLETRSGLAGSLTKEVTVMIGPEGDFTPTESAKAKKLGYQPIHLGPIVLRSETAAIYCLSVLAHELF